ncbi:hypothetical protein BpHYR1_037478 [Brachionus plicatilis]|uniref:PITH domain-containing protein n=1 Tax=Brachionus plicatilis TaxID=10195 RepID=A0A3M7Q5M8_BRAPC|nr:hypothetical protein BpHYR1_037478 [Brachionus plicatilis]
MAFRHNCNKENCDHQSANDQSEEWNLFCKIDLDNVQCLNEETDGSCKKIFRSWEDRLLREHNVKSDVDQELLFNIPFSGTVKIKSIVIIGENNESHPYNIKLFKNKPFMTFDDVGIECDQEIELVKDPEGIVAYPLKMVKFSSVSHLSIYVPRNYANDNDVQTSVYYVGLKGEFLAGLRQQVVITNYEAKPNPADHKTNVTESFFQNVS